MRSSKRPYPTPGPWRGRGRGSSAAVRAALRLHPPSLSPDLPESGEILRAKSRYAESRWMDKGGAAGYRKYPDKNILVMGWCGQADALGYALQVLGPKLGGDYAGRVRRSLDFLSTAEFYDGGFRTWHKADEGRWEGHEPLSQGQAMLNFAHAIRPGAAAAWIRKSGRNLCRAADFHAARILREDWRPKSTDEAFFIAPLCAAYTLFGGESCRDAAVKAGGAYAARSLSMREPYWGGTLDASCEDKEGAYAALQGFRAVRSHRRRGIPSSGRGTPATWSSPTPCSGTSTCPPDGCATTGSKPAAGPWSPRKTSTLTSSA